MSALDAVYARARALTGEGCLLRPDRAARALFVCDLPARDKDLSFRAREALEKAGFSAADEGALWRLDLTKAAREALIASVPRRELPACAMEAYLPALSLCRSLLSRGDTPADAQPWPPLRQTLLMLHAGRMDALVAALSADTALLKRAHTPLPTAAAYLILNELSLKEAFLC